MIPTPDLSHLTRQDYDLLYEPAGAPYICRLNCTFLFLTRESEDTFLFLDALESDADDLKNSKALICLEVG
jgi:release factor glutamine methyltransferase